MSADLTAIREKHTRNPADILFGDSCDSCETPWPCDTIKAIEACAALAREHAQSCAGGCGDRIAAAIEG